MNIRYLLIVSLLGGAAFAADCAVAGAVEPMPQVQPQQQAEKPERLEDVLAMAYRTNPALRAARAELKAVQEEMPQALSGWRPSADASANVTDSETDGSSFGGDGSTSKEVQLGLTQPLYRGGRTIAAVDGAEKTIAAKRALLRDAEQNILLSVATAYMDVLRDRAVLELGTSNENVIAKELEATQNRFDVGEVTRTDLAQAEARLARARADRIRAAGNLQSSRAAYEKTTGRLPGALETPGIAFDIPETLDETIAFAQENNPLVAAAENMHRASEQSVDEIFGELLPEVSAFGSWNRQYDPQPGLTDETTTSSFGLKASIPLYEGGAVRSRVRQAKHTANQRYLEILDVRRAVRERAVTSWENLKAAEAEIVSRKAQVQATEMAQEGVRAETVLGSRSVLDVLDAEQEHLDARVSLVTAQRNMTVAQFTLAATLGLLTPEILGFPDTGTEYDRHLDEINGKILGMEVEKVTESP